MTIEKEGEGGGKERRGTSEGSGSLRGGGGGDKSLPRSC